MIVFRLTHKVKPGCTQAVVDLLKEYREKRLNQDRTARIYHDRLGPRYTVIWENEYENFAAYANHMAAAEWKNHPMADTFWERLNKLIDGGGTTEIWNLE